MKSVFALVLILSLQSQATEVYRQACHVIGEDDYVEYSIEMQNAVQPQSAFALKLTAFEDENCETPYLQYNQYFHVADFQNGLLNLETEKITYTALSDEVAEALTLIHYCDVKTWKAQNEQAVTGKVCDDYEQLSEKQTLFQILNFTEAGLQFGEISSKQDGRSEKLRPTVFDSVGFTKVIAKPSLNVNSIPLK